MDKDCVFCDRNKTDDIFQNLIEEQIIFENEDFYLIAQPGQITDGGTTAIVPKEHIPCIGALEYGKNRGLATLTKHTCVATTIKYQRGVYSVPYRLTTFEHGVVGQSVAHAHLHILPAVIDLTPVVLSDFPSSKTEELLHSFHLQKLYDERREPYLFWTTPEGKSFVCWNPPAAVQYFRTVTANILDRPERASWRELKNNPERRERDRLLWQETVRRLKPYFPEGR